jgi:uncharacterized protein YndB with AHSA1/START domain
MNDNKTGVIERTGASANIVFERRLAHPLEAVWAALTDPKHRAAWIGQTTLEPRVGGAIEMTPEGPPVPPELSRMTGKIHVWDAPRVLEHAWHQATVGDTVVRYELRTDGPETVLRMTHSGFKPQHASGYLPGEHAYLDRLEAHLSGAEPPAWRHRYAELAPSYGGAWTPPRG